VKKGVKITLGTLATLFVIGAIVGPEESNSSKTVATAEPVVKTTGEILEGYGTAMGGECMRDIKKQAKYPSEVDFNWLDGVGMSVHENWDATSNFKHRVVWYREGKMMNGFGNMIPFKARCIYDIDLVAEKIKQTSIEVW
jgi:hypothetical protein